MTWIGWVAIGAWIVVFVFALALCKVAGKKAPRRETRPVI